MAAEAGGGCVLGIHHTQHRSSIDHRAASIHLVLRMAWIAEHPKYFLLKLVRLAVRGPIVDTGQLHTNTRLLIEMFSNAAGEHGMKEALEPDPWSIDHRLRLVDHFSLRLHQGEIEVRLRHDIGNAEIDLGFFLEPLQDLVGHEIRRKTLLSFCRVINGGLILRYHHAADLHQFDQVFRHFSGLIRGSGRRTPHQGDDRHPRRHYHKNLPAHNLFLLASGHVLECVVSLEFKFQHSSLSLADHSSLASESIISTSLESHTGIIQLSLHVTFIVDHDAHCRAGLQQQTCATRT